MHFSVRCPNKVNQMSQSESTENAAQETPKPEESEDGSPLVEPLRSVHTSNFPEILESLRASVFVTTYQAGRLVILRSQQGLLNTHFRLMDKPMGLALANNRLAIGSAVNVWEFHNLPAVGAKVDAGESESEDEGENQQSDAKPDSEQGLGTASVAETIHHDACFLPRTTHWTGDIQIHEMAWSDPIWSTDGVKQDSFDASAPKELVYINTLFSCLCRRSETYNFDPIWRPSFITKYVPGDCCHLNGLALRDGRPRYVTALGECDTPGGWRENKKDGGIVIDMENDEIIVRGLSMPHSPRWYHDRLWILESGHGGFGFIDPATGKYESILELPGFTRGLSFAGPLAFIGLSQVRESAVFGGVPIAQKALEERTCGVWVVNIETGNTVAFVKFEDAVQEIFAVEVAFGARYPEVVNEDRKLLAGSFELPEKALTDVPQELRSDS